MNPRDKEMLARAVARAAEREEQQARLWADDYDKEYVHNAIAAALRDVAKELGGTA